MKKKACTIALSVAIPYIILSSCAAKIHNDCKERLEENSRLIGISRGAEWENIRQLLGGQNSVLNQWMSVTRFLRYPARVIYDLDFNSAFPQLTVEPSKSY